MKKILLEKLICPACLPGEYPLVAKIMEEEQEDILEGVLLCEHCHSEFPITGGIAFLAPECENNSNGNQYEQEAVVSSYLWSHYGDLLGDEQASDAYPQWAAQITPQPGLALDLGGAVGRFTFEMSRKCDLAVGIDNSLAFVKTARELMKRRQLPVQLKEEGFLRREENVCLPAEWQSDRVEFIVGDAQKIPFPAQAASVVTSLNLVDKVPYPRKHLEEMNRVAARVQAQFLLSDPFSWSTEAAEVEEWLGGKKDGPFAGMGRENIKALLEDGEKGLTPVWKLEKSGHVWWKIRTHRNHYELIRSCFVKASR